MDDLSAADAVTPAILLTHAINVYAATAGRCERSLPASFLSVSRGFRFSFGVGTNRRFGPRHWSRRQVDMEETTFWRAWWITVVIAVVALAFLFWLGWPR